MTRESDLELLKSYHRHAASQRGTDNLFVKSVEVAIKALENGATTNEAFNAADHFADQLQKQKSEKNTNSQPHL